MPVSTLFPRGNTNKISVNETWERTVCVVYQCRKHYRKSKKGVRAYAVGALMDLTCNRNSIFLVVVNVIGANDTLHEFANRHTVGEDQGMKQMYEHKPGGFKLKGGARLALTQRGSRDRNSVHDENTNTMSKRSESPWSIPNDNGRAERGRWKTYVKRCIPVRDCNHCNKLS